MGSSSRAARIAARRGCAPAHAGTCHYGSPSLVFVTSVRSPPCSQAGCDSPVRHRSVGRSSGAFLCCRFARSGALNPDSAFAVGLALSLACNASDGRRGLSARRAEIRLRSSVALVGAGSASPSGPCWCSSPAPAVAATERGRSDLGLSLYTEPLSTALVLVALVMIVRRSASGTADVVTGALLGLRRPRASVERADPRLRAGVPRHLARATGARSSVAAGCARIRARGASVLAEELPEAQAAGLPGPPDSGSATRARPGSIRSSGTRRCSPCCSRSRCSARFGQHEGRLCCSGVAWRPRPLSTRSIRSLRSIHDFCS